MFKPPYAFHRECHHFFDSRFPIKSPFCVHYIKAVLFMYFLEFPVSMEWPVIFSEKINRFGLCLSLKPNPLTRIFPWYSIHVLKTMPFAPSPRHHHFDRWYSYHSQNGKFMIVLPTLLPFYPHEFDMIAIIAAPNLSLHGLIPFPDVPWCISTYIYPKNASIL